MRRTWQVSLVCLLAVHAHVAADPSADIADLYVQAAYEALMEQETDRAMQLVRIAREFDGASSDAHYLAATITSARQETAREAIEHARVGLDLAEWRRFDSERATVLLAGLYNRVGDHAAAVGLLRDMEHGPAVAQAVLSQWHYEYITALNALEQRAAADDLASAARDLYPDDPRFFWFFLRAEPHPSREYRRELERLLHATTRSHSSVGLPARGPRLADLLYEYGSRAPTGSERAWARDRLGDLDWPDPRIGLLYLPDDPEAAVDAFLTADGLSDYATLRDIVQRTAGAARARVLDAASEFSGTSLLDPQRDGWWSERLLVENGAVLRWERDLNRDGVVEFTVDFDERRPRALLLVADGQRIRLVYGQYPFLESAEVIDGLTREVYTLRPRAVSVAAVRALPSDGPRFDSDLALELPIRRVDRDELRSAAVRQDTLRPDGGVAERVYLRDGHAYRVLRDGHGDGAWDHLLLFDRDVPVAGVRDLTGDGYFEITEGYRDGRLVALAIDTTGNGVPDVFERHEEIPVREWDLNGDGRIDAREFRIWSESVTREFPLEER